MKTQNERVLEYLGEFGSITPLDALRDLGIMRLGARIWELKRDGCDIKSETTTVLNRWGQKVNVARYCLGNDMNKCWKCAQEQVGGTPCDIHSTSSCMVDSVVGCLDDAVKGRISMSGQAILQWDFMSNGFAAHSVQMPEEVVDQVLRWRDQSLAPNARNHDSSGSEIA